MGNSTSRRTVPCDKSDICKSITDVPNEVIQKFILVHLSSTDVRAFGMTGCKRFKVISDDVLEKRCKSTILDSSLETTEISEEIKCVIVGDGAVGKTSLIITYSTSVFPEDEEYARAVRVHVAKVMVNSRIIQLHLWDTAGQEEYDCRRPYYDYQRADVFIVCYSVDNKYHTSLSNVEHKWFPEVRYYCPETPIILVGTKTDLRDDEFKGTTANLKNHKTRMIPTEEGKAMAEKLNAAHYLECSALTGDGVQGVFDQAIQAVLSSRQHKNKKWHRRIFDLF